MPKKSAEVRCTISMPDHQEHTFIVTREQTAQALMDRVKQRLDVGPEIDYFGLYFLDSAPLEWLVLQDPLHGQLPKTDRSETKLEFGVKYYVSNPSKIVNEQTKYLFFHQLMDDLRSHRLSCSAQTTVQLCALAVQTLLGDFDPAEHTSGYMTKVLLDLGRSEIPEAQIHPLHKMLQGRDPLDAEHEFLKLASEQTMYGNEYFPAVMNKDRKRAVNIGIGEAGIKIFDRNTVCIQKYSWPEIVTITFDQTVLTLTISDEEGSGTSKIKFKCENKAVAKAVWMCGIQKHAFFQRRRVPPEKRPSVVKRALGIAKDSPLRRSKVQNKTAHQVIRASMKKAHEPDASPSPRGGNFRRLSYTRQGTPPKASPQSASVEHALSQRAHPSDVVQPAPVAAAPAASPLQNVQSTAQTTPPAAAPQTELRPVAPPRTVHQTPPPTLAEMNASPGGAADAGSRQHIRALGQFNDGYPVAPSALPFSCGDVLQILGDAESPAWWRAKNVSTNAFGVIPSQETCDGVGCRGYQKLVRCQPGERLRPVMIYGPMQSEVVDQLIMRRSDKFTTCVAHTTREQREGEIPGLDYEYVSDEQFETLKKSNYFAEFLQSGETRYGTSYSGLVKATETAGAGVTCLWDFHHSMAVVNMIESDMEPIVILVLPEDAEKVDPTLAPQEVQYALTMRSLYPSSISATVYSSTVDNLVEQVLGVIDVETKEPFWATEEDGCKSAVLNRGPKGFGFTVSSIGNKIASVFAGSPAAEAGNISVGDVIVAVNDIRTSNTLYTDLIMMIKSSQTLHLKLRPSGASGSPARVPSVRPPSTTITSPPPAVALAHNDEEDLPDFEDEDLPEWDDSHNIDPPTSPIISPIPPAQKRTSRPPPPKSGPRTSQPRPPPAARTSTDSAGAARPSRGSGSRPPPAPRTSGSAPRPPPAAPRTSGSRPPPTQPRTSATRQPPPPRTSTDSTLASTPAPRSSVEPRPPPAKQSVPPGPPPSSPPNAAPPPTNTGSASARKSQSFADMIKEQASRRNSVASDTAASPPPTSPPAQKPKGHSLTMEEELMAKFNRKEQHLDSEYDRSTGEVRRTEDAPVSEAAVAAMLARVGANAHGEVQESPSPQPSSSPQPATQTGSPVPYVQSDPPPAAPVPQQRPAPSPAARRAPPPKSTESKQMKPPQPRIPPPPHNVEPPPPPPTEKMSPFGRPSSQETPAVDDEYIEVEPVVEPGPPPVNSTSSTARPPSSDTNDSNRNVVSKRERIGTIAGGFEGHRTMTLDIEFTRPHGTSLGFRFGGGTDKPAKPGDFNVYVTGIVEGGAAEKDGRLRVGDRILEANGTVFTAVAHRTVVQVLKGNPTGVSLKVSRVDETKRPSSNARPSSRRPSSTDVPLKGAGWTSIDATEHIEIKKLPSGLGFSLRGGTDKPRDGDTNIYVTKLSPGGAAALDGRLQVDDKIVECNGVGFSEITHGTAIRTLKSTNETCMLVVSRRCRRYSISRANGVFGIGIKGGSDVGDAIHISVIVPESAAASTDLKVGQEISHINGEEVQLKTHAEVLELIKSTPNPGDLELIVHQRRAERSGRLAEAFTSTPDDAPTRLSTDDSANTMDGRVSVHKGDFRRLPAVFPGFDSSRHCSASLESSNQPRNRYIDILAYDHTRVALQSPVDGGDYINANYVDAEVEEGLGLRWIACQGPLQETANHFWTMVWENQVSVICMLTKLFERRPKCYKYWPDELEMYGDITVQIVSVEAGEGYIIRSFHVTRTGQATRLVHHCQFEAWPDHGVPDQPTDFLRFFDKVQELKSHTNSTTAPLLLHCSAGIGRTGVFILTELGIATLQRGHHVDMPDFTKMLRNQRMGLVQTEAQYDFVHTVLSDAANGTVKPAKVAIAPLPLDSTRQSR